MTGLALGLALLAPQAAPTLAVQGDVAHVLRLTNDDLRRRFADDLRDVSFAEKGVPARAHAFPLAVLLKAAAPRLDPLRKHPDLSLAIVALGPDGYSAVFSGAELSAEMGDDGVLVAVDWNDKPLASDDAPVRLFVPRDAKPARWVHGVRTLRVVNLAPKGHGPAPEGRKAPTKP